MCVCAFVRVGVGRGWDGGYGAIGLCVRVCVCVCQIDGRLCVQLSLSHKIQ